jgi:hypothetical protein
MKLLSRWLLAIFIIVFSLMPVALAHVPLGVGENDSLQNAARADNPTKSWAIYDDIQILIGGLILREAFLNKRGREPGSGWWS